jgi:hypothetical protein
MSVVQRRNDDYVLIPGDEMAINVTTGFVRIRAWSENPLVLFQAFSLSSFASGVCDVVR